MPSFPLALLQIIMGSSLAVLGYRDFRLAAAATKAREGLLDELDTALFPDMPEETMVQIRRATAAVLMLAGIGICIATLF
jgi:hypothetical protein